jgi:hypothetical protein
MQDPKKPAPADHAPTPSGEPNKGGGFGAFAELYRARWAATHPNMRRRGPATSADGSPDPPPPSSGPGQKASQTDGGTRLLRRED